MKTRKRSALSNVNWKRTLIAFSILIILVLLPIALYLYTSRTIDSVAYTMEDTYEDTTHINVAKSTNYDIVDNAVKLADGSAVLGDGADGACTVSSGTVSLSTASCSGRATADAVNFSSTVNTAAGSSSILLSSAPTGLSVGDEVLIINLQGTSLNYGDVGEYETRRIGSIDGNTLNFSDGGLTNGYDGTTQKIMVQRVPNYTSVSVSSGATLTADAWNGTRGGVLFFKSQGDVSVAGSLNMNAKGYRGGGDTRSGGESFCGYNNGAGGSYSTVGLAGTCGGGGGGGAITSASPGCIAAAGGAGGTVGGAGGGGGSNWWEGTAGNAGGGGGAGYGSFGYGGTGTYSGVNGGTNVSGAGGKGYVPATNCRAGGGYSGGGGGGGTYGDNSLSKLYFGSGGAQGGGVYRNTGSGLLGGTGGGIISVYTDSMTVTGSITSNGGAGQNSTTLGAACGGGSGGSILVGYSGTSDGNSISATGGTVLRSGIYTIHKFTSSGTFTVYGSGNVEVLVVGGGGGAGGSYTSGSATGAGAGGAGGVVHNASYAITSGAKTVTVGNGGASANNSEGRQGVTGGNSVFDTLIAYGGGGGGGVASFNGLSGGSGGGAAGNTSGVGGSATQGNAGGAGVGVSTYRGGGGGGFGSAGVAGAISGNGGNGTSEYSDLLTMANAGVDISGTRWIAGGGGAGGYLQGTAGVGGNGGGGNGGAIGLVNTGGVANTGGGAGGPYYSAYADVSGGSGIVIVKYETSKLSGGELIGATGGAGGVASYARGLAGGAGGVGRKAITNVPSYSTNMVLESLDLVPGDNQAIIKSFAYTLSALPSGTTASIQFSKDGSSWYSSTGVLDGQESLTVGEMNNINLESLSWESTSFYYKIVFTSDGNETPVLENIALEFDSAPEIPTIGVPQAMSTNTIRWNFTDNANNEEGFILVDGDNNFVKYCLGENLTYCDESGLLENTQYTRKIKAYNDLGESDPSSSAQAFTLVSAPSISFGSKSSTMISLEAEDIINSADIYFDCEGENCDTGINEWISETTASVTGLENNTGYPFRVKARNGDNVESAYSTSSTGYTLAVVPTLSADQPTGSTISLNITGVNNLASGNSGVYFECKDSDCNDGIAEWVQNESDVVISLQSNTEYEFRAKARNFDGTETAYSEYISVFTGADIPSAPIEKEKTIDSVKIALVKGGNPDSTEYAVLDETTGKYLNRSTNQLVEEAVWGTYAQYGGDSGINILGLSSGIEYKFKVKARNESNVESEFSPVLSVFTKLLTPTLLSATDIQKTTVNWSVTDNNSIKTGYRIYDQAGNLMLSCLASNMNDCRESNLASNTTYARKVKVYTNNSESDFSEVYQVTTLAQESALVSLTPVSYDALILGLSGSSRDKVQIVEDTTNQYLHKDLAVLTSSISELPFNQSIRVEGLKPNTSYTFKVRSSNTKGVLTTWSPTSSVYTFAQKPAMVKVDRIDSGSAKLYFNTLLNPSNTDFALRETNTGKYIDFSDGSFVEQEVWGKFEDFGGSKGLVVSGLEIGKQYGFAVQAKNFSSIVSDLSDSIYIGTSAILKNVGASLRTVLAESEGTDVTNPENGQFGEQKVRVLEGEYLVVDVPVLFAEDRDWADAILATSPKEKKTVVKLKEGHGVLKPFTMYVVGEDTNMFVLCPEAKNLEEINSKCEGAVKYSGPFPQRIDVEGDSVYVSQTVIGGVSYWVADGLTGTGGMGYYEKSSVVVEEEGTGVVLQVFVDIKDSIDAIEEPELQKITVATGAVSVAVGTTAALGGLSQLAYSIGQFFLSIFSALVYKRKRVHYGFVYDSKTKEPIHMALVRIMDSENKLVGTEVTNMNGRITGNLEPGKYTLIVSKRGYKFPSENIKSAEDYPISNVYTGSLVVSSSDSNIQIAIPMDPTEMTRMDRFIILSRGVISKIALVLNFLIFVGGISLTVYMYQKYPQTANFLIGLVYILPCYTLISSLFDKKGKYGKVVDKKGKAVEGVSVYIKEREFNKVVAKRITNEKGQYRFIVDKGNYEISIDSNSYEITDDLAQMLVDVKKDNHIIARKIKVRSI